MSGHQSRPGRSGSKADAPAGVRTRQIQRKLRGVASLPQEQAAALLPEDEQPQEEPEP